MSNVFTNNLNDKSYSLFMSSSDKVSGTNNNAVFQVNWDDFLPRNYTTYKVAFSFQSAGGNYKDTNASGTAAVAGSTMTVSGTGISGTLAIGQIVTMAGLSANTYITALGTGTGGAGTYTLSSTATIAAGTSFSSSIVYTGVKIGLNLQGRSFSFDTATKAPSITLGYAQRDIQTSASASNSYSTFYLQFPPKTIARPNQNMITVTINNVNGVGLVLTDTDTTGKVATDMTSWTMILEFTPVESSKVAI
jgi:hypothetical protein